MGENLTNMTRWLPWPACDPICLIWQCSLQCTCILIPLAMYVWQMAHVTSSLFTTHLAYNFHCSMLWFNCGNCCCCACMCASIMSITVAFPCRVTYIWHEYCCTTHNMSDQWLVISNQTGTYMVWRNFVRSLQKVIIIPHWNSDVAVIILWPWSRLSCLF